jgi:hypothetical protein
MDIMIQQHCLEVPSQATRGLVREICQGAYRVPESMVAPEASALRVDSEVS